MFFGHEVNQHRESQAVEDAGNNACSKQRTDGLAGKNTVNNHGNRGRNDGSHRAGHSLYRSGKFSRVFLLLHLGDQDTAHSRSGSRGQTGQRRKKRRGQHLHMRQSTGQPAHQ